MAISYVMIVLDPDENEILQEKSVMIQNGAKVENGVIHVTNKRILYEKQGERKLRRAEASKIFLEIPMYEIVNVASAVPKMSLMTKKKLSVEYRDNGEMKIVEFEIKHPESLVDTIKNWATTSKREHEEKMKSEDQERFRREVELAKAKAAKSNVNMINLGNGNQRRDVPADSGKSNMPRKVDTIEVCPECGEVVPENSKFCPHCGYKIHD
ncbi:zinc-ribbon domain-containing protein [Cuniculiplasma sp. SKW3]|uniref:zinc-ribbon domain-containing protein n=1 Tax=unclassified Cuniculiplasma TaxID=2619706 RepID=UPI003FD08839